MAYSNDFSLNRLIQALAMWLAYVVILSHVIYSDDLHRSKLHMPVVVKAQ
jgi:hypothetical protein